MNTFLVEGDLAERRDPTARVGCDSLAATKLALDWYRHSRRHLLVAARCLCVPSMQYHAEVREKPSF